MMNSSNFFIVSGVGQGAFLTKLKPCNSDISLDLKELYPDLKKLPTNHHFIGPLATSVKTKKPHWWNNAPRNKTIIFLSLGSSENTIAAKQLIHKLSRMDYIILVATAGKYQTQFQENIYVSDYLDANETIVLSDLVICNGGSEMVYLSLKYGVPVLGIPSNLDQHLVMDRIVSNKLGKMIRTKSIKTCQLGIVIKSLLEKKCKTNTLKFKSLFAQSDCLAAFKNIVDEHLTVVHSKKIV